MSADIARLDHLPQVLDHALGYCIELTGSKFGFIGLVDRERQTMDVAAIKGFGQNGVQVLALHAIAR